MPRLRGADDGSAITAAFATGDIERGIEALPGAEGAGEFAVEAKRYGYEDRVRVLAIATPLEAD
jgi:hypothetical protein